VEHLEGHQVEPLEERQAGHLEKRQVEPLEERQVEHLQERWAVRHLVGHLVGHLVVGVSVLVLVEHLLMELGAHSLERACSLRQPPGQPRRGLDSNHASTHGLGIGAQA